MSSWNISNQIHWIRYLKLLYILLIIKREKKSFDEGELSVSQKRHFNITPHTRWKHIHKELEISLQNVGYKTIKKQTDLANCMKEVPVNIIHQEQTNQLIMIILKSKLSNLYSRKQENLTSHSKFFDSCPGTSFFY